MRAARVLRIALLTALIPLASCTDAFGIGKRPIGTWSIEEYNGDRIPALFDVNSFESTEIGKCEESGNEKMLLLQHCVH